MPCCPVQYLIAFLKLLTCRILKSKYSDIDDDDDSENGIKQEAEALLDRHGALNGLFLIRPSTRSADCLTLDICFEREKKRYVITHFVSWFLCVNLSATSCSAVSLSVYNNT